MLKNKEQQELDKDEKRRNKTQKILLKSIDEIGIVS